MNIHICDICKLKIPDDEKIVFANYKTYVLGGFAMCKRCGKPIVDFLKKHHLIDDE